MKADGIARNEGLPETWPVEVKRQGFTVKIYKINRSSGYTEFKLVFYADGKRRFKTFAAYDEALKEAVKVGGSLSKGDAQALTLTSADRVIYLRAIAAVGPTGVALDLAANQFAEAHKRLEGRNISEAVEFYLKRHPTKLPSKTVTEAIEEFIEFTRKGGASDVYLKDLDFRLGKFSEANHCQIASVAATEINAFLRSLDCSQRGKANYKASIRTLFKYAIREKWLPKDHIDWQDVDTIRVGAPEIEIFTVEEMNKLLRATRQNPAGLTSGFNLRYANGQGLLPLLVLGGFAGLRTAEIQRQLWSDISLERGFIRVSAAKGNTAQKRLVPISSNLNKWLRNCRRGSATCCDYPRPEDAIRRLVKRAGVEWKHNGLRHSYISYRIAETQDVPKVSLEAGNSPKMIHRHYRELVTPADAKKWFSIAP
jgi:integrase